jgi:hypothetical protein
MRRESLAFAVAAQESTAVLALFDALVDPLPGNGRKQ